ncbi:MAG: short chain dehydrogenase [Bacteroidetes bacterium]|nr:MAG: short chain dehydrogenase [Bacteroidota bacterium]
MDSLFGKNIIITGASSGIGEAIAREAVKVGANIAIAARNIEKLDSIKSELADFESQIVTVKCDVTKQLDCQNLIDTTLSNLGSIDILINNAGITMRAPFEEVKLEVLEEVMNVNYWGAVYCTQAALPQLIKNKGSLVAVSSVTGFKGLPGRTAYASSKFALNGLFESLRMEYMGRGVHTLIACPGFTGSNIRFNARTTDGSLQGETPANESKMDKASDVALDILQAIRDKKDFMLTNKQGKIIYWVNKFFPKFVERRIHKVISQEPNSPILK